jgi:Ca-activated chloride channel family protein
MLLFMVAIAALIVAAARPQRTVAVPVNSAAILLANDVSSSMSATDVKPSRLEAAKRAAERFIGGVPTAIEVGSVQFASRPIVLQSPTTNHSLAQSAVASLGPPGGHTAIGDTIQTALHLLTTLPAQGTRRPPGAIVLLSDGGSDAGSDPLAAARQAAADRIPIYTVSLGTPHGTIAIRRGSTIVRQPVPVSSQLLQEVAHVSGGRFFTAANAGDASAVYAHLATELGHKQVKREITASFAGGGLVLLLLGSVLSLTWFGRLA